MQYNSHGLWSCSVSVPAPFLLQFADAETDKHQVEGMEMNNNAKLSIWYTQFEYSIVFLITRASMIQETYQFHQLRTRYNNV